MRVQQDDGNGARGDEQARPAAAPAESLGEHAAARATEAAQVAAEAAQRARHAAESARAQADADGTQASGGDADPDHDESAAPRAAEHALAETPVLPVPPDQLLHPADTVRAAVQAGRQAIQTAGQVAASVVVGPTLTDTPPPPPAPRSVRRLRRESWAFAAGALLFFIGTLLELLPGVGVYASNVSFVVGAIAFTTGAFIQLDVSGRRPPTRRTNLADRADWWSAAVQFAGTLCFNVSTAMALGVAIGNVPELSNGWRPDALGSSFFLASGFLAVVATSQRQHLWDPLARTWRSTWLNMLGSIAFGISAAVVFPASFVGLRAFEIPDAGLWSGVTTALGAVGFFFGAALARRTVRIYTKPPAASGR